MESNLITHALRYFDEESYMQLASHEKLNVEQVSRGMETIVPLLYLGLLQKSDADFSSYLLRLKGGFKPLEEREGIRFSEQSDLHDDADTDEQRRELLKSWFDESYQETLKNTCNFFELDSSEALNFFTSAIPAVLAALTGNGAHWDETTLRANLVNNKDSFLKEIPAGLPLPILLGEDLQPEEHELLEATPDGLAKEAQQVDPVRDVVFADPLIPSVPSDPASAESPESEYGKGAGWWWIVVAAALLLMWFFFGKGCTRVEPTEPHAARMEVGVTDPSVAYVRLAITASMR